MAFQLPIFELPLVLLPGEQLPLHVFEERYKRMIDSSLESGDPFGIVLRDAEGARSIGCTAVVTEILERFEDGRLNVVVTGGDPFRVLDRFDDPQDPAAEVELQPAGPEEADPALAQAARDAFRELAERASGERLAEADLAVESAYGLAARVELPAEFKQALLSSRREDDRMKMMATALTRLQDALERAEEVAERASTNGKVKIEP